MNRKFLSFLACVLITPLSVQMLDGVHSQSLSVSLLMGCALGAVYCLLRPILRLLTFPLGCVTFGLSGFVLDVAIIWGVAKYVPGFTVDTIMWAALMAVLVDGVCLIVGGVKA